MRVSIIAAMARNFVIGNESGMPWRLPSDLKRFRQLTMGKPVILGRKTLDLLPGPLPGRPNIVLTRNQDFRKREVHVAHTVEAALAIAGLLAERDGRDEIMVIGGAEVYRQFLPRADRLYLTIVDAEPAGSAFFPRELLNWNGECISLLETSPADERNQYTTHFVILERIPSGEPKTVPGISGTASLSGLFCAAS